MSGGSYDYLYRKAEDEPLSYGVDASLDAMVTRLAGLGYAKDAAEESMRLLAELRSIRVRLTVAIDRLAPIWRAVEWVDSGDSHEQAIKDELAKYRGQST